MAKLFYGAQPAPIEIPEDLLAHVKVVIATKLRRNESFLLSWVHADGGGRSSVWLQPSIPMRFEFDTADPADLDRALLASLAVEANSNTGIVLRLDGSAPPVHRGAPPRASEIDAGLALSAA